MASSQTELAVPRTYTDEERRAKRRFPLPLEVTYKLLRKGRQSGTGRILDMSSTGVRFTTNTALALGAAVELTVAWPALLNGAVSLKLILEGHVVRASDGEAAATVTRLEFYTHRQHALPAPAQPAWTPMQRSR